MPTDVIDIAATGKDLEQNSNFLYRLVTYYWIQTKVPGVMRLLTPNKAQKRIMRAMATCRRIIILKARQVGVSTLLLLWHLDATMFTPNTTTVILAHDRKSLERLFKIIKIAYENFPDSLQMENGEMWYKPQARYETKYELEFGAINSRIYVSLQVRGDTVHRLHGSEVAFLKHPEEVLTATLNAVPDEGIVTLESTANGVGGPFHEMWEDAEAADSQSPYFPIFIGYQHHEEYRDEIHDLESFEASLTDYEKELRAKHGVGLAALAWRRRKMTDKSVARAFVQEYPCNSREAFMHTGTTVFDLEKVDDWIILDPVESKMEGRLLYWRKPEPGRRYIVACDAASGRKGKGGETVGDNAGQKEGGTDYTVIMAFDCESLQLCCMFRAKWPYAKGHEPLVKIAREYNDAYVIVEATDHGLTILNNLELLTDYPEELIHSERTEDRDVDRRTRKVGFYTNQKTRPLIIDSLVVNVLEENVRIHSRRVQSEFYRFITHDDGKMAAMDGYKDDCVMCAAIATYPKNINLALQAIRNLHVTRKDLRL